MNEWWTYRPSDFLMFAPRAYWRLVEMHNTALWPIQPALVIAGLGWVAWLVAAVWRGHRGATLLRVGAAGLAAAWAFVAVAFLLQRYAPINWAASGFAVGFFAQAVCLAALATRADVRIAPRGVPSRVGLLLCAWALVGHPLLALALDRSFTQAEVFGVTPDPTAIATLGFVLSADAQHRLTRWLLGGLWIGALAWCAISTATLLTMGAPQGWVVLATALAAGFAAVHRHQRSARH